MNISLSQMIDPNRASLYFSTNPSHRSLALTACALIAIAVITAAATMYLSKKDQSQKNVNEPTTPFKKTKKKTKEPEPPTPHGAAACRQLVENLQPVSAPNSNLAESPLDTSLPGWDHDFDTQTTYVEDEDTNTTQIKLYEGYAFVVVLET